MLLHFVDVQASDKQGISSRRYSGIDQKKSDEYCDLRGFKRLRFTFSHKLDDGIASSLFVEGAVRF